VHLRDRPAPTESASRDRVTTPSSSCNSCKSPSLPSVFRRPWCRAVVRSPSRFQPAPVFAQFVLQAPRWRIVPLYRQYAHALRLVPWRVGPRHASRDFRKTHNGRSDTFYLICLPWLAVADSTWYGFRTTAITIGSERYWKKLNQGYDCSRLTVTKYNASA